MGNWGGGSGGGEGARAPGQACLRIDPRIVVAAGRDREMVSIARRPALAVLRGSCGLAEDVEFPARSEEMRAYLAV